MTHRHELTDIQWARLEPLLPPQRPTTGRPARDHRTIVNGILWRLATGAPWRDLPERYGSWQTVYSRWRRWQQAGVWRRALAALQADADTRGDLDWAMHFLDGTTIRAHQSAAGAKKRGGDQALGRSRGGFSTKIHLRTERGGKPICGVLTPGQRHEATQVAALLERGAVKRPSRGRPRRRPQRVVGDKGYTGRPIRTYLRQHGIGAVIPRLKTESRRGVRFDRAAYRERNVVERTINRLKQHRALATRYEKLEETFHALLTLACILLWL
ncbi:MAG TPA: IS5 family transposase [Thermomicrobiales bacterium]|nr:IS5 family transposase [Thermomicrobiales bacterium]